MGGVGAHAITPDVLKELERLFKLAPEHNPSSLEVIRRAANQ
jgi:acetate kinase